MKCDRSSATTREQRALRIPEMGMRPTDGRVRGTTTCHQARLLRTVAAKSGGTEHEPTGGGGTVSDAIIR